MHNLSKCFKFGGQWGYRCLRAVTCLAAVVLWTAVAQAEGPDDQYLQIYKTIEKGDALAEAGKADQARTNYWQAQAALLQFQRENPTWSPKLVTRRIAMLREKLSAPAQTATTVSAPGETTAKGAASEVKLLEPGAEPRKALRLHPVAGEKQRVEITLKMSTLSQTGTNKLPAMQLPTVTLTVETAVRKVGENGEISFEMTLQDAVVSDDPAGIAQVGEALKKVFAGAKGASGSGLITSRGFSRGVELRVPSGGDFQSGQLLEELKQFFVQLMPPLPEEAVGIGAKWQVKMPIQSKGVTLNQSATYELVSLEGDQLGTKYTLLQDAANQKIHVPNAPAQDRDLVKTTSRNTGERGLDLTKLMPISGTSEVHVETAVAFPVKNQKRVVTSKVDVQLSLESK